MNSIKTKAKKVLLAVYTAVYSLHSELYAVKHMQIYTESQISEKIGSSGTKLNVLATIENIASSLALPWIEIAATGLAKTRELIELHNFRSMGIYFEEIARLLK